MMSRTHGNGWSRGGRQVCLALLGLFLALAGPAFGAGPSRRPPIAFSGNLVLNDEVYLAVLDLPPDFVADKAGAALVRARLLSFLRRAGYELARVQTAVERGRILVDIEEGRVEKVILRGQGSLKTVQVLVGLSLPFNVFNRPYLERQLAELRSQNGVEVERFELVRTSKVSHLGPQVDDLGDIPIIEDIGKFVGHPLIPPRADYELHILFRRREWATGLGLVAGLSGVDGLRLGLEYRGEGLVLSGDRWSSGTQLGTRIRSRISNEQAYLALTRALAEFQWFAPRPRIGLRPTLVGRGELISRQRPDVGLESYMATRAQLVLALSYELFPGALLSLGVGGEELDVFALRPVEGGSASVGPSSTLQAYLSGTAHLLFDTDEIRRDRRHELEISARQYPNRSERAYGITTVRYQKVLEFGWHDVWLTSRGAFLWGAPPFIEEQPVGGLHVRGVFADRFYARRVASTGVEGRLSVTRDIYKVGGFADVAVFGDIDRVSGSAKPRVVSSIGPSFHVLIADAFQLDLYYAIGFASRGEAERGFTAALKQAF